MAEKDSLEHFAEWFGNSDCFVCRPGCYGVSVKEVLAAYRHFRETGDDCFRQLDLIAIPTPDEQDRTGECYFSKEQIADFDAIMGGKTCWNPRNAEKLRGRIEKSRAYWEWRDTYEARRPEANLAISDKALRKRIFERDGSTCRQCGATENLALDHIVSVLIGGGDDDDNLQVLCKSCNSKKGAR